MLKRRAIKKILITTLSMFIILTIYTVPMISKSKEKVLRTNFEIGEITGLQSITVYLLNSKNYFVKTEILIEEKKENQIEKMIESLKIDSKEIPIGLNGYLSKEVKLLSFNLDQEELVLNFSKEFLNPKVEEQVISGIVYSCLEQDKIKWVSFSVEGKPLEKYQKLTKEFGINKEYFLSSREDIQKVVIYYLDHSNMYYVPITKYINDDREKIEIIIEELRKTHKDLISLENIHTELLDYREIENVLFLNFNEYLLEENEDASEKLLQSIAYSVFDNYDVQMVMLEVNGKSLRYFHRK
ncbi:MAG: GerMN domain-containing protein [Bacilli bacterium]|nr:GerMN domain-containing protein [Bacilli bacterium]